MKKKKKARSKSAGSSPSRKKAEDRSTPFGSAWREQSTGIVAEVSREYIGRGFGQSRGDDE